MAVDIATGTTITHGTTSYSVEILGVSGEISRAVVDTTHMGTTGARIATVTDLYSPGSITVQTHFDFDEEAPYTTAAETVTVTFPSALASGATVAGSGAVTNFSWSAPLEDKAVATYTVTFLGALTWADASA